MKYYGGKSLNRALLNRLDTQRDISNTQWMRVWQGRTDNDTQDLEELEAGLRCYRGKFAVLQRQFCSEMRALVASLAWT